MSSTVASASIRTRDGRSLDVYRGGADAGARGTVLYLHGSPSAGIQGPGMAAACAAQGMQLISFSRAGYGSSSRRPGRSVADVVDDAADVLDALDVERAWVLGWSGGGPHALACVAIAPDRFRAAALIGGVAP